MGLRKIRVGGVPEHFNLPWHLAIEEGLFNKKEIEIEWITFKGGTGAMTKALRNNEVDLCILLTEGIIADIIKGNQSKIISTFVESPLVWGIHTGAKNKLEAHNEIYKEKYAISRFGSGSHLMAKVDAFYSEQEIKESQFEVINNLEGALSSLENLETDVFYWEKFTTKPYVDNGLLKRIGEYPTPWPCFVIAGTDEIINTQYDLVSDTLRVIHLMNNEFMNLPEAVDLVSERYKQRKEDVLEWYQNTKWGTNTSLDYDMIKRVIFTLQKAGVLKFGEDLPMEKIVKEF